MLAGGWGAEHSSAHGNSILTGAGCAGLAIRRPLDPLSKLLFIEHAGYSKGAVTMTTWTFHRSLCFPDYRTLPRTLALPSPRQPLNIL